MSDIILFGDCRESLRFFAENGFRARTCVTSPPYFGLRDYGHVGQLGLEQTPAEYVAAMVEVFRGVWDVLTDDGTLWLNIGDSYNSGASGGLGGSTLSGGQNNQARSNRSEKKKRNGLIEGLKQKDLIGIPWMLAFALRDAGWYLRQEIIWQKPNPMPESVTDRCTKAHEQIFLFSKQPSYYFDNEAIKEPAKEWGVRAAGFDRNGNTVAEHVLPGQKAAQHRPRPSVKRGGFNGKTETMASEGRNAFCAVVPTRNRRSVWTVATRPYKGAHFATFPPALIEPCILAGSAPGDTVLDPFIGSGTTAQVAKQHGRFYLGCELNQDYAPLQQERIDSIVNPA